MAHDVNNNIFNGRLTLSAGTAVTTVDVTTASTIYLTPYNGNQITLYDGVSSWSTYSLSEISLAIGTVTSGLAYDVFVYNSGGVGLTLEKLAWTNGTSRNISVVLQNGVYSRSDSLTHRYVGTFYTTNTANTEDSVLNRFVYNWQNQRPRQMLSYDGNAHSYSTTVNRAWNNNTSTYVQWIDGSGGTFSDIQVFFFLDGGGTIAGYLQIGVNSVNGILYNYIILNNVNNYRGAAGWTMQSQLGYNYATVVEYGAASCTYQAAGLSALVIQ